MLGLASVDAALEGSEAARTEGARRGGCDCRGEAAGEGMASVEKGEASPKGLAWSLGVVLPDDPSMEPGETGSLPIISSGVLAADA